MNTYITSTNQSLLDICLIIYGSLDYLVQLAFFNNLTITQQIPSNSAILYPSGQNPTNIRYTTGLSY